MVRAVVVVVGASLRRRRGRDKCFRQRLWNENETSGHLFFINAWLHKLNTMAYSGSVTLA